MSSKKVSLNVTLIGAGGLGTPFLWGLAEAFSTPNNSTLLDSNKFNLNLLGSLELVVKVFDSDLIEISNLNRQVLFKEADIGKGKAQILCQQISQQSPHSQISFLPSQERITSSTIELLKNSSIIVDCTDSVETKFMLNDYAAKNQIPFCYGGAIGREGLVLLAKNYDPKNHSACLRCLFGNFDADGDNGEMATCTSAGILGPVAGVIGFLQAELVSRFLFESLSPSQSEFKGQADSSEFYRFSTFRMEILKSRLQSDPVCPNNEKYDRFSVKKVSIHRLTEKIATDVVAPVKEDTETVTKTLDLRNERCPTTYLYTKLALEQLNSGNKLKVLLNSAEHAQKVYKSTLSEGHFPIEPPTESFDGCWEIGFIRK